MESFQEWLDFVLDMPLPDDSAAVNFNLCEQEENIYSIEFAGTGGFDPQDDD